MIENMMKKMKKDMIGKIFNKNSKSRGEVEDKNQGNTLYVHGISHSAKESEIIEKFETIGKVLTVKLIIDPYTKQTREFCFVTMEKSEDADKIMSELNGTTFQGSKLSIQKVIYFINHKVQKVF